MLAKWLLWFYLQEGSQIWLERGVPLELWNRFPIFRSFIRKDLMAARTVCQCVCQSVISLLKF